MAKGAREPLWDDFDGYVVVIVRVVRWLYPGWWFWHWFYARWVGHDCDSQPITCRAEFLFRLPHWVWLDV